MQKEQNIYPFLPTFYKAGITIIFCDVILSLIFIFLALYSRLEIQYTALIILLLCPFWFIGLYLIYHFKGRLIITKKSVILKKIFSKNKKINFKDIKEIIFFKTGFPPLLIIKSDQKTIKINRMIYKLPEIIKIIKDKTNYKSPKIKLPYTFKYSKKHIFTNIILFGTLIIFWGILAFFVYIENSQTLAVLSFMSLLVFIIPIIAVIYILMKNPIKIRASKKSLQIFYLTGKLLNLKWEDIFSISVKTIYVKSSKYNIGHYSYPVEIVHKKGKCILPEYRIKEFDTSPEILSQILNSLHKE